MFYFDINNEIIYDVKNPNDLLKYDKEKVISIDINHNRYLLNCLGKRLENGFFVILIVDGVEEKKLLPTYLMNYKNNIFFRVNGSFELINFDLHKAMIDVFYNKNKKWQMST